MSSETEKTVDLTDLDWDNLTEEQRLALSRLGSEFCGLHEVAGQSSGQYQLFEDVMEPGVITIMVPSRGECFVVNVVQSDLEAVGGILKELVEIGEKAHYVAAALEVHDVNQPEAIAARKAVPRPPIQGCADRILCVIE